MSHLQTIIRSQLSCIQVPSRDRRLGSFYSHPVYIHNVHVAVSIDFLTRISELPHDEAETKMINRARQSAAEMVSRGRRRRVGRFFSSIVI